MPADLEAETALLYKALAEPVGLLIATNDFELARGRLYKARAEAMDAELSVLSIRPSPLDEGQLIIIKTEGKKAFEKRVAGLLPKGL